MAGTGEEKLLPLEVINAEPHPPRRNKDFLHDEEFQRVVRDVIIGRDNVPGGHVLRLLTDPTAFEELIDYYRKAGLIEGQVWRSYDIFEGVEGLENLQDEMKMEEEPVKEEEAVRCRGRDATPDCPNEVKKRRLMGFELDSDREAVPCDLPPECLSNSWRLHLIILSSRT